MNKNSQVNDIFADDNGARNRTKTILLLTIVAVILIAVFLIIAWVMTRDNPIQSISVNNTESNITSGSSNGGANGTLNAQKPIPYAHSESQNPNPNLTDQLGLNVDSNLSTTPPIGVNTAGGDSKDSMPTFPPLPSSVASNTTTPNYENDPKYQENLNTKRI